MRDSDATLILVEAGGAAVSSGTQLAHASADALGKPRLVLDVTAHDSVARAKAWLAEIKPVVLGIGGPRESEAPGIYDKARRFLEAALGA